MNMTKRRRRAVLGSSPEEHERAFGLAVVTARAALNSAKQAIEDGDCRRALDRLLDLEVARGEANAHNLSGGKAKRDSETARAAAEVFHGHHDLKAKFKGMCRLSWKR